MPDPGRPGLDLSPEVARSDPLPGSLAVIDVDGVLADASHREHLVARRPKDWDGFFAAAGADAPIADGIRLARRLAAGHEVVLLSGRPERIRSVTEQWLDRHEVPRDRLLLRADDDRRPASRFKADALRALGRPDRVAVVVDDDPGVVRALSRLGYPAVLYPEPPGL